MVEYPLVLNFDNNNVIGKIIVKEGSLPEIHNYHLAPAWLYDGHKEETVCFSLVLDPVFRSYADTVKGLPGHE